jgi:hypothetical protein
MSRHGNPAFEMFKTSWAETYRVLLRANSYYVGHIGKWHNGKFPAEHFDFGRSYGGTYFLKQTDGSMIHVTQKNENDALKFLRTRPRVKPFVLTLAFFATCAENQHPKQSRYQPASESLYQKVTIPIPKTAGKRDPHEKRNLANNQKYQQTLADLRQQFARLKAEAK